MVENCTKDNDELQYRRTPKWKSANGSKTTKASSSMTYEVNGRYRSRIIERVGQLLLGPEGWAIIINHREAGR